MACFVLGDASKGLQGNNAILGADVTTGNGNGSLLVGGGAYWVNHNRVVCIFCNGSAVLTNTLDPSTANGQGFFGWYDDGALTINSLTGVGLINDWRFGTNQSQYIFPQTITFSGAKGSDKAGGDGRIRGGEGTGLATPGALYLATTTAGSTGTTTQTFTDRVKVDGLGNFTLLNGTKLQLTGSSSGTMNVVAPATAGSGTLTLPVATDTLIGKATTDTLTNKTFDTAGTGNVLKVNGSSITAVTGGGSTVALSQRLVAAKTANYTVLLADSGTFFTNTGASGEVDFTLETPVAGARHTFYVDAVQTVKIIATGSATINFQGTVSTTNGNILSAVNGNVITLIAIDSTHWVCEARTPTSWTVN